LRGVNQEKKMADITVKVGKKAEKDNVDSSKIGKGSKPASGGDVQGQAQAWTAVSCPYCWAVNEVVVDSNQWLGYYCWNCAGYFEV
jgi:hypothetical protein